MTNPGQVLGAMLAVAAATGALPAAASAYFAPGANVVSASLERLEQGDDLTTQVALSGNGRFAAFATRARNFFPDDDPDPKGQFRAGGIFRRDLQTGALELVAHGDLRDESAPDTILTRGALNPSISRDGRFVAFSTGWALSPDDTNGNVDVYVRDMSKPWSSSDAYELVSRTSSGAPARYGTAIGLDRPGANPGAEVTARTAISADGRKVVFRTATVPSDLPGEPDVTTPGEQVLVRDLGADTTSLVTRDRSTGAPAGGGLGAAVISADGSTVAWVGREAPRQTVILPGEGDNPTLEYYLWKRIADGEAAPTRRVTGLVDPEDPSCGPFGGIVDSPVSTGPCYGPLATNEGFAGGILNQVPGLSADGTRVAYITSASPRGLLTGGAAGDLWVTDLRPGVSRKSTSVELTRDGGPTLETNAPIESVALSADGRWAAVTTLRTGQVVQLLRPIGTARAQATTRDVQLIDLAERTIERVSVGASGADTDGPAAGVPAISDDGRRLAFLSTATNLFFGDANGKQDAFVVDRLDAPPPEPPDVTPPEDLLPPVVISSTPDEVVSTRLVVRSSRGRRSKVALRIAFPEPGTGRVTARGKLRNSKGKRVGKTRTLASRKVAVKRAGTLKLSVSLKPSLRPRLRTAKRLTASTRIEFTGDSGKDYVGRVSVEFRP